MRCQRLDRQSGGRFRLGGLIAAGSVLALSACAQTNPSAYRSYSGAYSPPRHVAVAAPPKLEKEVDGMPAQHPPVLRRGKVPDDPSEPFSPNYGPPPVDGAKPDAAPVGIVRKATMSNSEVEAIIARAVVAHELRSEARPAQ